jgi:hypothetical protein
VRLDDDAVEDGEAHRCLRGLAAPVAGADGAVLAAIAIAVRDCGSLDEHIEHAGGRRSALTAEPGTAIPQACAYARTVASRSVGCASAADNGEVVGVDTL